MAKQTFSVGQVLTAAQMTSLQQTAMGGGSPSVKTSSYVLVAADAGTVIQVNSTSATTITVNTGLFSSGDSVQIQNIGSGTTTITAGTATVNSAGSLAVTQYDGGFLYFSSASSAIWFDYTQPGTTSPLTTKGDLYTRTSTGDARLAVGANGTTLVADSAEATGLKWAAVAAGTSYAVFRDEKTSGTAGGSQTLGAFRTRDLNTTQFNNITGASLASNQVTLPAGTFFIEAIAPQRGSNVTSRWYNITDSSVAVAGQTNYMEAWGETKLFGYFTITSSKTFELQYRSTQTEPSNGLGVPASYSIPEVYAMVHIVKVA